MTRLTILRFALDLAVVMTLSASATPLTGGQVFNTDLDVRVSGLSSLMARSSDLSDVLLTSLDTIIHDRSVCCGKESALGDSAAGADARSLSDVASKLQGRHLMGDGRPMEVTAEFWSKDQINSGKVIGSLTDKHALLMQWDSHLYVVYGAVYRWVWVGGGGDQGATPETVIRKFELLDPRFSDYRRSVVFDRDKDDFSKVQGILFLEYKLP